VPRALACARFARRRLLSLTDRRRSARDLWPQALEFGELGSIASIYGSGILGAFDACACMTPTERSGLGLIHQETDRLGVLAVSCVAGVGAIASGCRAHIPGRCEISGSPVEIRRCSRNCEAPSGDKPGTLLTPRCKPSEEGVARVAVRRPPETSLLRISRRFFYVTCGAHRGRGGGCAVCVGSYASAAGQPSSSETTRAGSCSGE
jgi:hypothetical protein